MDIKKIRVERLKALIQELGGAAEVERNYDNINASYLSQLINGFRPFGEKSARNLEAKLNLEINYFDRLSQTINYEELTPLQIKVLSLMQSMPQYGQEAVFKDAMKTDELISQAQTPIKRKVTQ